MVVVAVVWGLITHGTFAGSGDAPHYMVIAQSIAFDQDFDLANNYEEGTPVLSNEPLPPGEHARPGRDGRLRPVHDVGLPLLLAPVVAVAQPLAIRAGATLPPEVLRRLRLDTILILRHVTSLAMALLAALLAVQFFGLFTRQAPALVSALWALLFTLSPPLLSHAFLTFTEIPSALLAVWLFGRLSDSEDRPKPWLAIGAATGFLLLLHVRNIAFAAIFTTWALVELARARQSQRQLALWAVGAAATLGARAALMSLFWGTFLTSPHATGNLALPLVDAVRESWVRASGLMLDQEFGLLSYGPVYALWPAGAFLLWKNGGAGRWALALVAGYAATLIVPYVNVHGWTGGWAPAARMLVPAVPFLALAVFAAARRANTAGRWIVATLVALQVASDIVVWQWPKSLWNYGDGRSDLWFRLPWLQEAWPAWHGPSANPLPFIVAIAIWAAGTMVWLRRSSGAAQASIAPATHLDQHR